MVRYRLIGLLITTTNRCPGLILVFFQPQVEAVNAFSQNWHDTYNWLTPPIYLVNRAIDHARVCKVQGILVVPVWQSAAYWPEVHRLLQIVNSPFTQHMVLGNIFQNNLNQ